MDISSKDQNSKNNTNNEEPMRPMVYYISVKLKLIFIELSFRMEIKLFPVLRIQRYVKN